MTWRHAPRGGPTLAQVQAEYPGWMCWVGLSGTCYALHLAALRTDPPPPFGEVYVLRASNPAGLRRQLRTGRLASPPRRTRPACDGEVAGLLSAEPGPQAVTEVLQMISELCARAAWLSEYGEQEGTSNLPVPAEKLTALSDLAALGAELNQRGYLAHLTMTPPLLTIGHPQARRPQRIYAEGAFMCWGDDRVPFCERWIAPATVAAGEVEVLTALAIAYEHEAAAHPQEPQ